MVLAASGSKSAAGATMRSAQQSNSNTKANTTNPRGPTGPSNSQPRSSPAGGGSPGAVSRGNYGTNASSWSGGGGGGGNNRSTASPRSGVQGSVSPTSGNSRGSNPVSTTPNAAAAKASQALNAGLGRPSVPSRGLGTYTTNLGVGGAALGSFKSVNDVALRNYVGPSLRGATGPNGEFRYQPSNYGTAYQVAQRLRDAYPSRWGRYSQTSATNAVNRLSQSLPGEADVNRYPAGAMNNLGRVGINKVVGGRTLGEMLSDMDTTGIRGGTSAFAMPGPNSMGMTTNWADRQLGNAYNTLALGSINEALDNKGVSPQARNASNFVAAGTRMVPGVNPVGDPVYGTQFGSDPNWGTRIADRNAQAVQRASIASENRSFIDSALDAFKSPVASLKDQDRLPNEATPPLASPTVQGNTTTIPVTPRATSVGGGLGIQAYNASVPSYRVVGTPAESTTAQRNAFYGSTPPAASTYSGYGTFNGPTIVTTPDPRADDPNYAGWRQTVVPAEPARVYDYPRKPYGTKTKTLINAPLGLVPIVGDINTGLSLAGYSVGDYIVNEENKLANMTPEQRDRYRAYWAEKRANAPGRGPENRGSRDLAMRSDPPPTRPKEPTQTSRPSKPASSTWEADAKAYGYTDAQLKDPETRDLIKQLWEMGFIPKSNPST